MSKKSFLKGGSAALLVSSVGGSFVPSNVKADDSFVLNKKHFLKENLSKKNLLDRDSIQESEDNSSSSNDYFVAFKSTVAYWWLKFCESSVFKYFFGKSRESKKVEEKVEEKVLEAVVLSEEKVKKIRELASKLEEKFGNKIKLEPYKNGKIQGTIVIGGHKCGLSVDFDEDLFVRIRYSKWQTKAFLVGDIENIEDIVRWHDVVDKTLERIDKLVFAGLFSRTVVESNGIIFLEPTASCKEFYLKKSDSSFVSKPLRAICFNPYDGCLCFCTSKNCLCNIKDRQDIEDCHIKGSFMELCNEESFKTFDDAVSKMLERHEANKREKKRSSLNTQEEVVLFSSRFGNYDSFFVKD